MLLLPFLTVVFSPEFEGQQKYPVGFDFDVVNGEFWGLSGQPLAVS
jgi:hypothetical protein